MTTTAVYESLRASRALGDEDELIGRVEEAAVAQWGEGVFDFHADELSERKLVLFGTGMAASMQLDTGLMEGLSSASLIQSARRRMLKSFDQPATPRLAGRLSLTPTRESFGDAILLSAWVRPERLIVHEWNQVIGTINDAVGEELPWPHARFKIKLATLIDTERYIKREDLKKVATVLSERVKVERGKLEPVTFSLYEESGVQRAR